MSSSTKKPVSKVTFYPVSAAIWRNENAKGQAFYSVTFERKYKDEEGNPQSAASFNDTDLLLLAKAADHAHTEIKSLRAKDRKDQPAEQE